MIEFKQKKEPKVIAVDFDATVVKEAWPFKGDDVPGAEETIKKLQASGHHIILLTQREHIKHGECEDVLEIALEWFREKGIKLFAVNENPNQSLFYYVSRKVYADVYVDDHSAMIPTIKDDGTPYVDWRILDKWFESEGYYD